MYKIYCDRSYHTCISYHLTCLSVAYSK